MGDSNSNWQGVYFNGPLTLGSASTDDDIPLDPRSVLNSAWNPATPSLPGTSSNFKGYFSPKDRLCVIWMEIDESQQSTLDGSYLEFKSGRNLFYKIQKPDLTIISDSVVLESAY